MFVSAMLIFGTIGIFRRYIPLSSAFLAFSRGILGGLFLLGFTGLTHRHFREKVPVRTVLRLAFTGAVMGINWILLFEAYNYTTVAVATLCYYMQPTIVMLLSPFLFREKLTWKKGICALAAVAGMVLVSGVIHGGNAQPGNPRGVLLGLGAGSGYALYSIFSRYALERGYHSFTINLYTFLFAAAACLPLVDIRKVFSVCSQSLSMCVFSVLCGLITTVIPYIAYNFGLATVETGKAAIIASVEPVVATLIGFLLFHETLSFGNIVGIGLVLTAIAISQ